MADSGDIWQRYDAKVMQIQVMEARLAAAEREVVQAREERDHWARICRDLGKKLSVARTLAERLRSAERTKGTRQDTARTRRPAELQTVVNAVGAARTKEEFDRAREVLGLVLTALTKALDDDAVAELGRRLRHHAGGKLLHSITRGSLTLVPVDGRYLVDRQWLDQLDLDGLRRELDVAAQSGNYAMPEDSLPGAETVQIDVEVEVENDDYDNGSAALPPPPPLPVAGFAAPPPLLSALPDDSSDANPRPVIDTVRTVNPLGGVRIPNLSIGRLIKRPT